MNGKKAKQIRRFLRDNTHYDVSVKHYNSKVMKVVDVPTGALHADGTSVMVQQARVTISLETIGRGLYQVFKKSYRQGLQSFL